MSTAISRSDDPAATDWLLDVALAPSALAARTEMPLPARTVYIVVDVIRATTTLTVALERGAERIYVAPGIAQAREARRALADAAPSGAPALLAGEAGGLAPAGFDVGNSPAEFARLALTRKDIVFATTNGTRALLACAGGMAVLAGALRNASAVAAVAVSLAARMAGVSPPQGEQVGYTRTSGPGDIASEAFISANHRIPAAVVLVCSGRGGLPAYDDTLCAGVIAGYVQAGMRNAGQSARLGEGARIALAAAFEGQRLGMRAALTASDAGRAVVEVGLEGYLDWCAAIDATDVVPQVVGTAQGGLLVMRRWDAAS
jgi:2-phosphosulfolactate phosphatase